MGFELALLWASLLHNATVGQPGFNALWHIFLNFNVEDQELPFYMMQFRHIRSLNSLFSQLFESGTTTSYTNVAIH